MKDHSCPDSTSSLALCMKILHPCPSHSNLCQIQKNSKELIMLDPALLLLMLCHGDVDEGGADEDKGGGALRRGDTCGEGSACGGGFGDVKHSLYQKTLKVVISFFQCCSSKARNSHDFSDPTLPASSIGSHMFLTINFRLLHKTLPSFL